MIFEIFRWFGIVTGWPFQFLFFKRKTYYENKRSQGKYIKGGALVISNHFSVVDYIMNLFLVLPRKLFIVTAELAFRDRYTAFGMRFFGGIKADRDTHSMRFIDDSTKVIRKGRIVQIFPEAHNTDTGEIKDFKPSYLMIALRANCPIVPIIGNGRYGIFKRASVIIGEKIYLSDYCDTIDPTKEQIIAMNEAVRAKCLQLREQLRELSGH